MVVLVAKRSSAAQCFSERWVVEIKSGTFKGIHAWVSTPILFISPHKKNSGAVTRVFHGNHGNKTRCERHKNVCEPKNLETLNLSNLREEQKLFVKIAVYTSHEGTVINKQIRQTRRVQRVLYPHYGARCWIFYLLFARTDANWREGVRDVCQ
jgi:hypothetical protein